MNGNKVLQITLAIIKPHILKNPYALQSIRKIIKDSQFKIVRSHKQCLTTDLAEMFYEEHRKKFFFNRLITFMTSDLSEFYILARDQAIQEWRRLMGPTKVFKAQFTHPESIRGSFGLSDTRNATHGSDSPESVKKEINLFFPNFNIDLWYKNEEIFFRRNELVFDKNTFVHLPFMKK